MLQYFGSILDKTTLIFHALLPTKLLYIYPCFFLSHEDRVFSSDRTCPWTKLNINLLFLMHLIINILNCNDKNAVVNIEYLNLNYNIFFHPTGQH